MKAVLLSVLLFYLIGIINQLEHWLSNSSPTRIYCNHWWHLDINPTIDPRDALCDRRNNPLTTITDFFFSTFCARDCLLTRSGYENALFSIFSSFILKPSQAACFFFVNSSFSLSCFFCLSLHRIDYHWSVVSSSSSKISGNKAKRGHSEQLKDF